MPYAVLYISNLFVAISNVSGSKNSILLTSDKNGDEDPPVCPGPVVVRFDISIVCVRRACMSVKLSRAGWRTEADLYCS